MHELSITQSIVEACSERAGDAQVSCVTLEIGTLSCVMPDSLRFCYDVASQGTPLQGSKLEIIQIPGTSHCRDCGATVEMHDILTQCGCGSVNLEPPTGGEQLNIKSMRIEEPA